MSYTNGLAEINPVCFLCWDLICTVGQHQEKRFLWACADSEDLDQPAYQHSLNRVFILVLLSC